MMELTESSIISASCLCKKGTITLQGLPIRSHYCHCTTCQSLHSAPFALVAVYGSSNLFLPDDHEELLATFTPKTGLTVYRCRECGVSIFSRVENYDVWGVYVGAGINIKGQRIQPREVSAFEGVMHMFYNERQRDVK
jgi:hypothetical protein